MKIPSFRRAKNDAPVVRRRLSEQPPRAVETSTPQTEPVLTYRRMQYRQGSDDTASPATRASLHALRRRQRSLWSLLLASGLAVAVLFVVIYQSVLRVDVSLYGQVGAISKDSQTQFAATINRYYAEHPLQRMRVFLDRDGLLAYLQQHDHSEVREIVSFQPNGIGGASISLKVREPLAAWTVNGSRYFVDKDGVVFQHNFYTEPKISIRDDNLLAPVKDGSPVASTRFLQFVGQAAGYFAANKIDIKTVIMPSGSTRTVEFELVSGMHVKMTIDRPVGEQAEDAVRAVAYFATHGVTPAYADVRVSRVAYYK